MKAGDKMRWKSVMVLLAVSFVLVSVSVSTHGESYLHPFSEASAKIHTKVKADVLTSIVFDKPDKKLDVLVKAKSEEELESISEYIESQGGKIKGKFSVGDVITAEMPANKITILAANPIVDSIWPNRVYHVVLDESVPQINASVLWDMGYNGSGILIAILDTGIDSSHPMLQDKVILEEEFTGEGHTWDGHGHGTHCAGIAAGNGDLLGVAPGALLMNAKVMDDGGHGTDEQIIAGINWAVENNADVISMSLGGPYDDLDSPMHSAISDAVATGVVVVVAAGNCGEDCPSTDCGGYIGVETPGNSLDAISVGAVDNQSHWACFSSGGVVNETIIKPDVVAPGVGINSSTPEGYASWSGTSMAAPHVAGAAALLLQMNPNMTAQDVKYIMEKTALELGEPGKDTKYGSGMIDVGNFVPSTIHRILRFRLDFPELIYHNDELNIILNATFGDVLSADVIIEGPDSSAYHLEFTKVNDYEWHALFLNTSQTGLYKLNVSILDVWDNTTIFGEEFYVARYNLTDGVINNVIIPSDVAHNSTMSITIDFENIGNFTLNVLFELQIWNSGMLDSVESERTGVEANSSRSFNMNWTANAPLGEKKLKVIASYEGGYHIRERTFSIIDNTAPVIKGVEFDSTLEKNNPLLVEVEVQDMSDLEGNITFHDPYSGSETIDIGTLPSIGSIKHLAATYTGTMQAGSYSFDVRICDTGGGLCTTSTGHTFHVQSCSSPGILVVSESSEAEPERFEAVLNNSYCISIWDESKSFTPKLDYLQRFKAVIWATGNYFGSNVDEESSELLINYTNNGGRLFLEGPDIAFRHGYDGFIINVTHSILDTDLTLMNETNISIVKTYNHPVLDDLPENLSFNLSECPYPDSLLSFDSGASLADWSTANSAMVVYNGMAESGTKTVFVPFMLNALAESHQNTLIENIVEWLLTDSNNPDLLVKEIHEGYPIEGQNAINIEIENAGPVHAINARIDVLVDGLLETTTNSDILAGQTLDITPTVSLTPGIHEIAVEVNSDFALTESNYLNNMKKKNMTVATLKADLAVDSVSHVIVGDTVNITSVVTNIGGSNADSFVTGFFIDGILIENISTSINAGEMAMFNTTWFAEPGMHIFSLWVNPAQTIDESNYNNNYLEQTLYLCNKSSILIVDDSDTGGSSTDSPSSAGVFLDVLLRNGYCASLWNESELGTPTAGYMEQFELLIWSSGDYWNTVIDENDTSLIEQYNGSMLFEGSDIAFDHDNDTLMQEHLYSILDKDLMLDNQSALILGLHEILENISEIRLNSSLSPYPDSVIPMNTGESIANWTDSGSAIVVYNDSSRKTVYMSFSVDAVSNSTTRERIILQSVDWLLEGGGVDGDVDGDCKVDIFDLAAVGLAFGSQSGDANWNPKADLTRDMKVDIFDLATVGLNYGRSCSG